MQPHGVLVAGGWWGDNQHANHPTAAMYLDASETQKVLSLVAEEYKSTQMALLLGRNAPDNGCNA